MTDPRLTRVPKVLETPKLDNDMLTDSCMLHLLRGFAAEWILILFARAWRRSRRRRRHIVARRKQR